MPSVRITIATRIEYKQHLMVKLIAANLGISIADVISAALANYLISEVPEDIYQQAKRQAEEQMAREISE